MNSESIYIGILILDGMDEHVEDLKGKEGIVRFLKEHLFTKSFEDKTEIRIIDSSIALGILTTGAC